MLSRLKTASTFLEVLIRLIFVYIQIDQLNFCLYSKPFCCSKINCTSTEMSEDSYALFLTDSTGIFLTKKSRFLRFFYGIKGDIYLPTIKFLK